MKDITIGVIHKTEDVSILKKKMNRFSVKPIVSTNDETLKNFETIPSFEKNAVAKNMFIKKAIENQSKYLFIIHDYVDIIDYRIFDEYMRLMNLYDLRVVTNGYTNSSNYVFNTPNPCMKLKYQGKEIIFNRQIGRDFMVIRIDENVKYFDEELSILENEYYVAAYEEEDQRFEHFRIDINTAWKYVKCKDTMIDPNNIPLIDADHNYKKFVPAMPKNTDKVLAFFIKWFKLHDKSSFEV